MNDVDGRHFLDQMLPHLDAHQTRLTTEQLAEADSRIRPPLVPTTVCIWGEVNAAQYGYERATHWWYFHRPRVVDESWRAY